MADDETAQEDRTEAPSHKRLQKAYDEGKLPLGRDFNAVAGFVRPTVEVASVDFFSATSRLVMSQR